MKLVTNSMKPGDRTRHLGTNSTDLTESVGMTHDDNFITPVESEDNHKEMKDDTTVRRADDEQQPTSCKSARSRHLSD